MNYIVSEPRGPFRSVVRSDGQVCAMQIPDAKWAERIARGLAMLDVAEAAHIRKVDELARLILLVNAEQNKP